MMWDLHQTRDGETNRQRMVRTQLAARGIDDQRVLDAMARVTRESFVSPDWQDAAYNDQALPIECSQTISQPFTVAFMIEAAQITENDKVLEIGTGSGYGAAVLSHLAGEVHTVERISLLVETSSKRLRELGYSNVRVHEADGTLGLPEHAPYDAIIVTAGAITLPPPYIEQLSDGGRVVIPIGSTRRTQMMTRFTLRRGQLVKEELGCFAFVPLIGAHGWQSDAC